MGFVLSSLWLGMTYIYASSILVERGVKPVYNWGLIIPMSIFLILCVGAFIYGVRWVREGKAEEREKLSRYRAVMGK